MTANLELGVVGNSVVAALVDPVGRIVWMCYPRLDGDPVFCSLLDGDEKVEGSFSIDLHGFAESSQRYLGNTAVLETILTDGSGSSVRIVDYAPRFKQFDRLYRPPTIIRRIEPLGGMPLVTIRLRPRFNYGAEPAKRTVGSNHIRYFSESPPALSGTLRLTTDAPIAHIVAEQPFALTQPLTMVLGPDETFTGSVPRLGVDFLERTREYWIEWQRYLSVPFEWQDAVIRAAITLKLCAFEETGAIVAALTTSVPEAADTPRTWDYRYCWLRDSYFVVHALNRLGATLTMEDFLRYITTVAQTETSGVLKPVYGLLPSIPLDERTVPSLKGYRGMGPVRVGNLAQVQVQNDSYGSIILAAAQMFFDLRLPHVGDIELFRRLERLGRKAAAVAFEPDAGLWEFRGRLRVHTHSTAMCWAACDRLAKIAQVLDEKAAADEWRDIADGIRERLLAEAWNAELNSFVDAHGSTEVDASLLLMQEIGLVAADDPRFLGTLSLIEKRLRRGAHLMRYAAPDDFGLPETSFTVCTFWYIDALVAVGRKEEARVLFEQVLACRTRHGLLSEDLDPFRGELWGNFPQTYSMVGLIISAMRLSKSWEEAFWRGS
ncbi:GH15 family glucan-1,4-alpha-glucosidase [Stella humosa]|uniref:GH15 family glucan-1,4-alpha-glucosidase n=1 Tax=Stella humosa TaxID=94 RepID=A0A3N1MDU4_9PROT|nr:glycoside hydrolase family 15 protein [Stella humosa]ROQ01901.1 GH15 family glucan-1,4-alpha-glucosidase [Stella humosa]BBK32290.1 glucoamylase [Stella humosa]